MNQSTLRASGRCYVRGDVRSDGPRALPGLLARQHAVYLMRRSAAGLLISPLLMEVQAISTIDSLIWRPGRGAAHSPPPGAPSQDFSVLPSAATWHRFLLSLPLPSLVKTRNDHIDCSLGYSSVLKGIMRRVTWPSGQWRRRGQKADTIDVSSGPQYCRERVWDGSIAALGPA